MPPAKKEDKAGRPEGWPPGYDGRGDEPRNRDRRDKKEGAP